MASPTNPSRPPASSRYTPSYFALFACGVALSLVGVALLATRSTTPAADAMVAPRRTASVGPVEEEEPTGSAAPPPADVSSSASGFHSRAF